MPIHSSCSVVLKGFAQVMLQRTALTGLCFLLGIISQSVMMAGAACLGLAASMLTAKLIKSPSAKFHDGHYGYNGVLVGLAMCFFYQPSLDLNGLMVVGLILAGGALSTLLIDRLFCRFTIPAYTAPFVLSTWLLIFIASEVIGFKSSMLTSESVAPGSVAALSYIHLLESALLGVGQVLFQTTILASGLLVLGLLLSDFKIAMLVLSASLLAALIASGFDFAVALIELGIYGYNAVLAALALSQAYKRNFAIICIGITLAVLITWLFIINSLIALTAPFVLSCWLVLAAKKLISLTSIKRVLS